MARREATNANNVKEHEYDIKLNRSSFKYFTFFFFFSKSNEKKTNFCNEVCYFV